jgi:predicted AAA+ superfamily ATPase
MYWKRQLQETFEHARKHFPAVLVTGPRQSGKTTFLRHTAPDCAYVTFDDPLQRQRATQDPNGFLEQFKTGSVVLDEVQYVPELFAYLKLRIDAERERNGRFLMTGSQNFQLMRHISDSLAGRLGILELPPFSLAEMSDAGKLEIPDLIWRGGYPTVVLHPSGRDSWISAYVQTYLERDIRQLHTVHDLRAFETYIGLCAARHGQELNLLELSRECGVVANTSKAWFSVLNASYILWTLSPYFRNFGKRLVKSPKMYFWDSALAAYLSRQPNAEALWHGAAGGAFFEGFIVMEAVKTFLTRGQRPNLYFWRSQDGLEVDLLVETGGKLHGVEIKQTATPTAGHAQPLLRWQQILGPTICGESILVCCVDKPTEIVHGITALPWQFFHHWLKQQLGPNV